MSQEEEINPQEESKGVRDRVAEAKAKAAKAREQAHKAKVAGKAGLGLSKATIVGAFNPITWIIIGLVLLIFFGFALFQVVGRTENADGCYGIGGNSKHVAVVSSEDYEENAKSVGSWLTSTNFKLLGDKPMDKNQAAGVIGNFGHESNLNPKTVQIGSGLRSDMSNEEILKVGSVGGKGIGFAQWDSDRRVKLVNFAIEKGKNWSDMDIQLQYLKMEMEDQYEAERLKNYSFTDIGKDVKHYVKAFQEAFERAGVPSYDERYKKGEDFAATFTGGTYTAKTGGSCTNSNGNTNVSEDVKGAIELAQSIAYPSGSTEDMVSPGDNNGVNNAKPEYKEAKDKAQELGGADPMPTLYASCDRVVATLLKHTFDKDIPWGSTTEQEQYLSTSSKWERYSDRSEAKPGDVWITKTNGHVVMYLGEIDGVETIIQGSYTMSVAGIEEVDWVFNKGQLVDNQNRDYWGYHFIG